MSVFTRPNCIYNYCPYPEGCTERCVFPASEPKLPAAVSEVMLPPNGLCWFGDGSCKKPQTNTSFYCADHEHKQPVAPQGTVEETDFTETDCSSRAGIVVGLVDGVIAIAQAWNRLLTHPMPDDPAVIAAFKDMRSNKDVQEFFGISEFDALMANFRSDFPLGKLSSGSVTQQGTVEGETRPKLEATYFVHGKDGSIEVSNDPYRRDYVSYQDFCVIRELLLRPPVTQEIPPMDVTKDDIYEAERRLYLRKRGNGPLRLDLMAETVCRERQWQQTFGKVAESVAPPSVAMQECSAITAGWDKCSYCDDGLYEEWLIQQWPDEEERRHESHVHGSKMRLAWEAGRRCAASKAALPVAASGEGSGVPTSENDRLCRAYLDLAAAYAERNQLKIELDELKAALSSPLQEGAELGRLFTKVIDDTYNYWDSDEDSKVGKRLRALSGGLKGYDPEITELLRLISLLVAPPETKGGS